MSSPQVLPVPTEEDTERRAAEARAQAAKDKGDSGADSNLFSDPSAASKPEPPRTLKRPPEQHDYGKELEESQKQFRSYEEEQQHQIQRFHELNQKYSEQGRPLLQSIIDEQGHLSDTPPNTTPNPELQKLVQAYQQKQPGGVNTIFQMMMLGLALAFTAFGWRRGYGARAGIMEGWGNAFKAFGQEKKEAAQDQLDRTYQLQKLVWEENKERHQQLMEIYQNRRLNLAEKAKIFDETEKLYGMDTNRVKSEATMTQQHMKTLNDQMRVQRDLYKIQMATHNKVSDFMFNSMPGKEWAELVIAETSKPDGPTGGRIVNPRTMRDEDIAEAEEIIPYEKFLARKKNEVPAPQKPGQTKSLDEASKKFGESFLSGGK